MSYVPTLRYFPEGKGSELFRKLSRDRRFRVERVSEEDPKLDYEGNVCAWLIRNGSSVAVGRPDENGFLHELSRTLGIDLRKYRRL